MKRRVNVARTRCAKKKKPPAGKYAGGGEVNPQVVIGASVREGDLSDSTHFGFSALKRVLADGFGKGCEFHFVAERLAADRIENRFTLPEASGA